MSTNFAFAKSPFRKRFMLPDEAVLRPTAGPDIQPMPVQVPQMAPMMPPPQPPSSNMGGPGAGDAFSRFAGMGVDALRRTHAPDVKPQPGGNPLGDLPQKGGKFLGLFADGGEIGKRQVGIVGERGPELVVNTGRGKTKVFPLDMLMPTGEQAPQPSAAPQGGEFPRPFSFEGANDAPAVRARTVGPREAAPAYEPPTVPMAGKIRAQPQPGEEDANNSRFLEALARTNPSLSAPPGYAGEGVPSGAGELTQRPRWASALNEEAEHNASLRAAVEHPETLPKASKLERFLWRPLRLASQGIASTGSPAGGLGALAVGEIEGALNPRAASEWKFRRQLGESDARLGQMQAQGDAELERADKIAGIENKRSQTFKNLNPERKPLQHVSVSDRAYTFDPNDGTYTDANLPGGPKLKTGTDELGLFLYDPDNPNAEIIRPKGAELKQFVNVEGYGRMTPGQKYNADATKEERTYQRGRDAKRDADTDAQRDYDATVKQIDRDNQTTKERYAAATKAVGELRAAIKAGQAAAAKVNNPHGIWDAKEKKFYSADSNDIARYREEYEKANQLVNTLGSSIRQNYGDFVDDDPDMKLPILLRPEPVAKAYPQRQPPAQKTGGSVQNVPKGKDPLGLYQ